MCILSVPENKGRLAFFAGIEKAKFRRKILPGETIKLELEIIKIRGPIGIGKAVASVDGERAVTAELTFALGEKVPEGA